MMNDFKLGIKMLRYGSGMAPTMVTSVIFLVLGMVMNIMDKALGVVGLSGDMIMIIMAMLPIQVIYSLSVSNLVQSSPAKKRMQTSAPAAVACICIIALYLLLSLANGIMAIAHPELIGAICVETVTIGMFAFCIMLSLGAAYKHFWVSIILGVVVYFIISSRMTLVEKLRFGIFADDAGSFVLALVIGLVLIVLGGFGQYGMSLLVYKAPMSKYSQSAILRKEM
ncbi:MAG: hypothetical protein NC245_17135 [Muribaculum sp.]|nr:hypothetical protein [Muribaculum sp.]